MMSTHTLARQVPINNTIQVNVAPGDETGLYHILISNLPWQTSWQQVKDHVRTVCSAVERVEIFNESTAGWISVRGRENFDAAMHLLETTPFNGRPLWVDGRNAKAEMPIRRLVNTPEMLAPTSRSPHTPRSAPQVPQYPAATSPMMMSPTASDYSHWSSGGPVSMISSPTATYGLQSAPMMMTHAHNDFGAWNSATEYTYGEPSTALLSYPTDINYQCPPTAYYGNDLVYSPRQDSGSTRPQTDQYNAQGIVETVFRKIHIKGLPNWAQSEQIKGLLRSRCAFTGGEVKHISVPTSSKGGNRGYATVVFLSSGCATRAFQKLDGHKFDGKRLEVKITKEGVSKDEEDRHKHHSSKKHRDEKEKKGSSSKSSEPPEEKKDKAIRKGVIIANGSSIKPGGSTKKSSHSNDHT
ncbi:hypothetical protein TruAng_008326 [Truncatella angustata]|nr:hypothetical protein TruAng_008326 [Truncatella angustata]